MNRLTHITTGLLTGILLMATLLLTHLYKC